MDMNVDSVSSNDINKDISLQTASSMRELMEKIPFEHCLSFLQGIVAAIVWYAKDIKSNTHANKEDGMEKLILSWFSQTDALTGLKFSKYIKPECIDIDIDSLMNNK